MILGVSYELPKIICREFLSRNQHRRLLRNKTKRYQVRQQIIKRPLVETLIHRIADFSILTSWCSHLALKLATLALCQALMQHLARSPQPPSGQAA